jgi:hypothetical protein
MTAISCDIVTLHLTEQVVSGEQRYYRHKKAEKSTWLRERIVTRSGTQKKSLRDGVVRAKMAHILL